MGVGRKLVLVLSLSLIGAVAVSGAPAVVGAPSHSVAHSVAPRHDRPAARANGKGLVTTGELEGNYYVHQGERDSQHLCTYTITYEYHFDEVFTTSGHQLDNNEQPEWHFKTLSGVSKKRPDSSPACDPKVFPDLDPPCSAPIELRPGWVGSNSDAVNIYRTPRLHEGYDYSVVGYTPPFGLATESTCGDVKGRYSNPYGNDGGPYQIRNSKVPSGHKVTTQLPIKENHTHNTGDGITFKHVHGHMSLTLDTEHPGKEEPSPNRKARLARDLAKEAAKADLGPAFENAKGPCLNYALGLGLFGAGSLLAGTPAVGPTFTVAGSLTALAAEPFCVATIKRIGTDLKIYNDPPDPRIHQLARPHRVTATKLPKCTQSNPDVKAFCVSLEAALVTWDTAGKRVTSDAGALSTTVNRLSAAIKHHKKKAELAQAKHARSLVATFRKAKKAMASAGAALAKVYSDDGLSMPVSHKRATQAIHFMLSKLKKQHVTKKQVTSVNKHALATKPYDGLKALSAG